MQRMLWRRRLKVLQIELPQSHAPCKRAEMNWRELYLLEAHTHIYSRNAATVNLSAETGTVIRDVNHY